MKRIVLTLVPWLLLGSLLASTGLYMRARSAASNEAAERARAMAAEVQACRSTAAIECCLSELPLTSEQVKQLAEACGGCSADAKQLEGEADAIMKQIEDAIAKPEIDRATVDELVDRLCDARKRELKTRIDSILIVRDVLAPDQIERLRALLRGQ